MDVSVASPSFWGVDGIAPKRGLFMCQGPSRWRMRAQSGLRPADNRLIGGLQAGRFLTAAAFASGIGRHRGLANAMTIRKSYVGQRPAAGATSRRQLWTVIISGGSPGPGPRGRMVGRSQVASVSWRRSCGGPRRRGRGSAGRADRGRKESPGRSRSGRTRSLRLVHRHGAWYLVGT